MCACWRVRVRVRVCACMVCVQVFINPHCTPYLVSTAASSLSDMPLKQREATQLSQVAQL